MVIYVIYYYKKMFTKKNIIMQLLCIMQWTVNVNLSAMTAYCTQTSNTIVYRLAVLYKKFLIKYM